MKMLLNTKSRSLTTLLALMIAAMQMVACGGSQTKPDDQAEKVKPEKSEAEKLAEEMSMDVETVRTFQAAIAEQEKAETDTKKVEELLLTVIEAEPNFAEAHYNLGVLYSNMTRYEDAVNHLEQAREIEPGSLDHTVALAQAYAVTEEYGKALKLFEEVVARQPANLTAKNNLAVLALKEGDDEKAMEYVRDVLREDDQNVGALNTLGLIYKKRDNISLAKYVFEKAIKLTEKTPDPDIHNNLGLVFMAEDNVPRAVDQFEAANKADPNYLESRLNLGAVLIEYLDYERAAEQFNAAVRIAPDHCVARLGKAASNYGKGAHEDAAEEFKYYVAECDTDHVSSYERLAKLYESKLNDPAEAVKYYEKLLTLVEDEDKKTNYKAMANFLKSQIDSSSQKAPEEEAAPEEETAQDEEQVEEEMDEEAPAEGEEAAEEAEAETAEAEAAVE